MMNNTERQLVRQGTLTEEIKEFIDFKRQSGSLYRIPEYTLKAFDRFCASPENQELSPRQLAEAWANRGHAQPNYDGGCCVRQLGQYLTEVGHPKAFTMLSAKGNAPRQLGVNHGRFTEEIKEFIDYKRSIGKKYITEEYCLKAFDLFCSMKKYDTLTPQQLADKWRSEIGEKSGVNIGMVRELGLFLAIRASEKAFAVHYSNGNMPKPAFAGYASIFAREIEAFLEAKRSAGLKYRQEEFRLKDFDRFCIERPDLAPRQLADDFLRSRKAIGVSMGKRSVSAIREFGKYLVDNDCKNAFNANSNYFAAGPFAEDIAAFVALKQSCGLKYKSSEYHLKCFDAFYASGENESLSPQMVADKWMLKHGDEHPNTRAGRVGPVRVFGKYLMSIGHSGAFAVEYDAAVRKAPDPPYLFTEDDIDMFFSACANLKPDEKEPSIYIVLPAAFMFMHCMGVRTCELVILMENVNLDTGEVVIVDAKTGDRVVYMSSELSEHLKLYNAAIENFFPNRKYMFPASVGKPRNDFAKRFSEIWSANVPAMGHGMPRLYDFRHHFLYRNVELFLLNGNDVNAMRPYIMKHMGHKLPESFQYYFHLSPPIRKEVSRIKNSLDWMIPDVQEVPYE